MLAYLNKNRRYQNTGRNIRFALIALGFRNVPQYCAYLTKESDEFCIAAMVAIGQQGE